MPFHADTPVRSATMPNNLTHTIRKVTKTDFTNREGRKQSDSISSLFIIKGFPVYGSMQKFYDRDISALQFQYLHFIFMAGLIFNIISCFKFQYSQNSK